MTATVDNGKVNDMNANLEGRLASAMKDIKDMVDNNSRYMGSPSFSIHDSLRMHICTYTYIAFESRY